MPNDSMNDMIQLFLVLIFLDKSHEQVDIFLANMVFNQQLSSGCRRIGQTKSARPIDRFIVGATHGYPHCYSLQT